MGRRKPFSDVVAAMTAEERIERAKKCIKELTYRIQIVIELHAANEILQYSSALSGQIPPSPAAVAHNILQEAMFHQEIIRLLALWDEPADNAVSVPLAIALINDKIVIDLICKEIFEAHANRGVRVLNPSNDPDIQDAIDEAVRFSQNDFAQDQSKKAATALKSCVETAMKFKSDGLAEGLNNLRDRIAHSVSETRREIAGNKARAKYGHEKTVLFKTAAVIEDLYCWVNGTSFDISRDCFENAREHARDLWMNLRFVKTED